MRRTFALPLAWLLLAAFAVLARLRRWSPARAVLLAALRCASRPTPAGGRSHAVDTVRPADLLDSFAAAYRLQPATIPCLPRALALHRLLVLFGVPGRVRLGLAAERPSAAGEQPARPRLRLAGHAWVECGGVPVGESGAAVARFRPCETS